VAADEATFHPIENSRDIRAGEKRLKTNTVSRYQEKMACQSMVRSAKQMILPNRRMTGNI